MASDRCANSNVLEKLPRKIVFTRVKVCFFTRVVFFTRVCFLFLRAGILISGSRGGPRDGDRSESRDAFGCRLGCVEAGTGRFEFPEDGEHWTTIWTGGAGANYLRPSGKVPPSQLPQHWPGAGAVKVPPISVQKGSQDAQEKKQSITN